MAIIRLSIPAQALTFTTTTVILVRHADIDIPPTATDPSLNAAGVERARELAHVLAPAGIAEILVSQATRTHETARPSATTLGLTPVRMTTVDDIVQRIRTRNRGQRVLVVGHSNTLPQIIARFGGGEVPPIVEREFDRLFVLVVTELAPMRTTVAWLISISITGRQVGTVLQMQYGAST